MAVFARWFDLEQCDGCYCDFVCAYRYGYHLLQVYVYLYGQQFVGQLVQRHLELHHAYRVDQLLGIGFYRRWSVLILPHFVGYFVLLYTFRRYLEQLGGDLWYDQLLYRCLVGYCYGRYRNHYVYVWYGWLYVNCFHV